MEPPASHPSRPSRRRVLTTGAGLALGTALGSGALRPPRSTAAAADTSVSFRRWQAGEFVAGTHTGTRAVPSGLVLASPISRFTYAGPLGTRTYDQAVWTSPTVWTAGPATEVVPSWNAHTPDGTWVELRVGGLTTTGRPTGWFTLARWCSTDPGQGGHLYRGSVAGQANGNARLDVDTLRAQTGVAFAAWVLQIVLVRPAGTSLTPVVRTAGAVASTRPATFTPSDPGVASGRVLPVLAYSQEMHRGHYPQWDGGGEAWCSPTSTAMVLRYWGSGPSAASVGWVRPPVDAPVDAAARAVYDNTYQGCGNWGFNTAYAGTFDLDVLVTRLRSLREAELFVRAGIPLVASVAFTRAELPAAGYATAGHLLVICGFTAAGDVVVNDPASHLLPDDGQVRAVYPRAQLERAMWKGSGGLVYVIHPTSVALPARTAVASW